MAAWTGADSSERGVLAQRYGIESPISGARPPLTRLHVRGATSERGAQGPRLGTWHHSRRRISRRPRPWHRTRGTPPRASRRMTCRNGGRRGCGGRRMGSASSPVPRAVTITAGPRAANTYLAWSLCIRLYCWQAITARGAGGSSSRPPRASASVVSSIVNRCLLRPDHRAPQPRRRLADEEHDALRRECPPQTPHACPAISIVLH